MTNPVFREIVGTKTASLPGVGPITAVNDLLGQDGIIGIKTGFTEAAGGNLAFAAERNINGRPVTIIGAVFGQATRPVAFAETRRLITTLGQTLKAARVMSAGQVVATVDSEWAGPIDVYADGDVDIVFWPGMTLEMTVSLDPPEAPRAAGEQVGSLTVRLGEQENVLPLKLTRDLKPPSIIWRLFHM
jgi:D-alanyl-D-alanine carboxypeptidase (penicillin-binding protein 5/6)